MRRARTEDGVVTSWLIRVLLVVGVLGVILFDSGSIAWNYFGVDSTADGIAVDLAETAENMRGNVTAAVQEEAKRLAREAGARLVGDVKITANTIEITIRRRANTLVVGQIDPIAKWGRASATASATYH
jgi:hypothetical protein